MLHGVLYLLLCARLARHGGKSLSRIVDAFVSGYQRQRHRPALYCDLNCLRDHLLLPAAQCQFSSSALSRPAQRSISFQAGKNGAARPPNGSGAASQSRASEIERIVGRTLSLSFDQYGAQCSGFKTGESAWSQCRLLHVQPEFCRKPGYRLRGNKGYRKCHEGTRPWLRDGRLGRRRVVEHGVGDHQAAYSDAGFA